MERSDGDRALQKQMGLLLRTGVLISAAIVAVGGGLYLTGEGASIPDYGVFHSEPDELRSLSAIVESARALDSRGLMQLGLLVVLATPVVGVVLELVTFARRRNILYVGIAAIVLAVLVHSLTFS
ncbi:DUF1634 domain-containing protein [Gloeobacter violaceus]|uniref:Glr3991 protein n=1 Tax=Gloeobacter violaceus (strain ATCC 29082 / PCC 7421) TaxID=251221 RepID=Q7NE89_GLOVI|nr:DUF1634 domain-containing protein [Gloeobacter violaceus]BAC91932.1 glr3991 [Gloeobacter violaceus PCC 7421]